MTRIPYPDESELDDDAREVLASLPPLTRGIRRMFAGGPGLAATDGRLGAGDPAAGRSSGFRGCASLAILAVGRACGSHL